MLDSHPFPSSMRSYQLPTRRIPLTPIQEVDHEWLVTNGLGGYSAGSIAGPPTRRYHGLLVAALPPPLGRTIVLNHLSERIELSDGRKFVLSEPERYPDAPLKMSDYMREFILEGGLPCWIYQVEDIIIEKRVRMPHHQNSVHIEYRQVSGPPVQLHLRPLFQFRHHEEAARPKFNEAYSVSAQADRFEVHASEVCLRLFLVGEKTSVLLNEAKFYDTFYRLERSRGYEAHDRLWSPGVFNWNLNVDQPAVLMASTENWDTVLALTPEEVEKSERLRREHLLQAADATTPEMAELVLAADSFLMTPHTRTQDLARAHALGEEARSIIAGYYWFTDWGRDTMISLEGLTLCTGRTREARFILHTFAHYVRDGLIPNMFPDGQNDGLYHTADATMWFFHALDRYLEYTSDYETLQFLLPTLLDILESHIRGTRFGIRMDLNDGLLTQGAPGYQLTWMDAKVGDWVVTPRRGKTVEINSLWYNAVCLVSQWLKESDDAGRWKALGLRIKTSFNERFWSGDHGYLFDIVDGENGNDASLRPNQILSFALHHPVLDRAHWPDVIHRVESELLTPVGLRSLAPSHPDYKPRYDGDLRARDAAYHQGTVWAWLMGPLIDAYLRVYPKDFEGARKKLLGFIPHLETAGSGSISEIFDAEAPYHARGCPAQAWSIAEVLRCWRKTEMRH